MIARKRGFAKAQVWAYSLGIPRPGWTKLGLLLALVTALGIVGCGGYPSASSTPPNVTVSITPNSASLQTGGTQQFTASITGTTYTGVTWSTTGGNISSSGLYTAPNSAGTQTVTATSVADTTKSASATVTITAQAAITVTVSPTSATVTTGATQQFSATVTGTTNTAVTWSVNGVNGGNSTVGTISTSGLYTAPSAVPSPNTVTITATSQADTTKSAAAAVTVTGSRVSSITKDGITWTFSQPVPVGQFVNGDYYVIGPATVTAINPPPATSSPYKNGSVLNLPTSNGKSAFDERLNDGIDQSGWFDASLRVYPPISLRPGDALVSSISLDQIHSVPEVMRSMDMNISPVRTMSILTVLSDAVTPDALRPSYCDRNQTIYRANNLQRALLPSLTPPNLAGTPPLSQFETWFRRPWVDMSPFNFDVPAEYMPGYSAQIAFADGYASLLLMLNFPPDQKVSLTNYFVQYGIDLFGCVQAGYGWPAFGGHRSGRKLPIVFAGILLNNNAMKNVSSLYPDRFGEDMQTINVTQVPPPGTYQRAWQGATVIYGGHYGVKSNGQIVSPGLYGPYEHLQPRDWPTYSGGRPLGEDYRRCCTSVSWVGEALAMRLLRAESVWNHPAFFDYVDRWMSEDDTQAIADIKAQIGIDYSQDWQRQGQTRFMLQGGFPQYTFIDDMWKAYR